MAHAGGRPTVMTDEVVKKLEEAFSMGCSDSEACFLAGISRATYYNYEEKYPEFIDRKVMLKDKLITKSRRNIQEKINEGDQDTSKWYLERKKKAEFSTRTETDLSGGLTLKTSDILDQLEEQNRSEASGQELEDKKSV